MRTSLNPGSFLTNPADFFIKWNGAVEKLKTADGSIEQTGGFLYYADADHDYEKVQLPMPFEVYPIGESYSIAGGVYDPNGANSTMVSSTEFGGWDEPFKVYERHPGDTNGTLIAEGKWEDINETIKAHKGKLQTNLYAVAKIDNDYRMVRIQLTGAGSFALSAYRKKARSSYFNQPMKFTGAEYKVNGTVTYAAPVIDAGDSYDPEFIKRVIEPFAKEINEYGNALAERNRSNLQPPMIATDYPDDFVATAAAEALSSSDSTSGVVSPSTLDREETDNQQISLGEIPF